MRASLEKGHRGLSLAEELMLLALRDKKGTVSASAYFSYVLGGALLAELFFLERVSLVDPKKKKLDLVSREQTGNPLLEECLVKLARAKRKASLQTWVTRFAGLKQLKPRIAQQLCSKGILRADEDKVLLLFRRRIYPEINPKPEREIVERMRAALFGDGRVDAHTAALVSLAHRGNLLKNVFDRSELKERKERLRWIQKGEGVDKAVKDAITAVQGAATAAMVAASVAASS